MKTIGSALKNVLILFSFIVNLALVIVVLALIGLFGQIRDSVVTPLLTGLHSSFVGLDEATIDWTIPVRDRIPVVLDIPLQTETVVTLTQSVPLLVNAQITLPGGGGNLAATVALTLPQGLNLPVALDLNVPVDEQLDIRMDVRAVIPVSQTQLHDPIDNLRLTFEPLVRALDNLPGDLGGMIALLGDLAAGRANLLAETAYSRDPWPGFSETAGLNYALAGEPIPIANQPLVTGLVPEGGIPALDSALRPALYTDGSSPAAHNAQAAAHLDALGIPASSYDGSFAAQSAAEAPSG
jgi:hypothetical protein